MCSISASPISLVIRLLIRHPDTPLGSPKEDNGRLSFKKCNLVVDENRNLSGKADEKVKTTEADI